MLIFELNRRQSAQACQLSLRPTIWQAQSRDYFTKLILRLTVTAIVDFLCQSFGAQDFPKGVRPSQIFQNLPSVPGYGDLI